MHFDINIYKIIKFLCLWTNSSFRLTNLSKHPDSLDCLITMFSTMPIGLDLANRISQKNKEGLEFRVHTVVSPLSCAVQADRILSLIIYLESNVTKWIKITHHQSLASRANIQ